MKHTVPVTIVLLVLFFCSQIIGVAILSQYINIQESTAEQTEYHALPLNMEPPEMSPGGSLLYIVFAILAGTVLILLIDRFNLVWLWKGWFFVAIVICLVIVFDRFMPMWLAFSIGILAAFFKVIKVNVIVHNLSELIIYSAIVTIFVQLIKYIEIAALLLIIIALYDYLAVFKIKHMVKLADFQKNSNVFAGLLVPYSKKGIALTAPLSTPNKKSPHSDSKSASSVPPRPERSGGMTTAIIGGGDISFPLLFTGTVFQKIAPQNYVLAWVFALLIIVLSTSALSFLFAKSKQNKYYPAMPILSGGVFIGFLLCLLLDLILQTNLIFFSL